MKKILISLIHLYQKMPLTSHGACHFYPTCSNYTIEAIEEYGSIKGLFLGFKRILSFLALKEYLDVTLEQGLDMTQLLERRKRMKRSVKNLGKIAFLGIAILFTTTGCKSDDMEDIEIVTTNYPNEYIIERLYGDHAKVSNIYPDGIDVSDYKFTNKQKRDFASKDLFIYTGLIDRERSLAVDLLDYNKDLKIIDSSYVLDNDYNMEEVWLDPSFMLMMSQNVRLGLKEYIENNYLKEEIDKNYEELKVDISELDADIRLAVESAPYKTIVATDNNYKFLEKYGVKVYILNDDTSEKDLVEINDLVENGDITKIFSYEDIKNINNVQNLINTYPNNLEIINSNRIIVLDDEQRETETDYLTLMNQNLDNIREELYHSNS